MDNIQVPVNEYAIIHGRRNSSTSAASSTNTPPRSPLFFFGTGAAMGRQGTATSPLPNQLAASPGGLSVHSNEGLRRFSSSPAPGLMPGGRGRFCTMDCPNCRQMARQLRGSGSQTSFENFVVSAPCSRKSSGGIGKLAFYPPGLARQRINEGAKRSLSSSVGNDVVESFRRVDKRRLKSWLWLWALGSCPRGLFNLNARR